MVSFGSARPGGAVDHAACMTIFDPGGIRTIVGMTLSFDTLARE
jgi:hypothetical protein